MMSFDFDKSNSVIDDLINTEYNNNFVTQLSVL